MGALSHKPDMWGHPRMTVQEAKAALIRARTEGDDETAARMNAELVWQLLERPNWPPWKAFKSDMFRAMERICPEGQFTVFADDLVTPLAALNMQRISWNGDPSSVPSWGDMMGYPLRFAHAYTSNGNTLVMLNINVSPTARGANLPARLIDLAIASAEQNGITNIIGLFRPNRYGAYKLEAFEQTGKAFDDFAFYAALRDGNGNMQDAWLRNLERNGMQPMGISHDTYSKEVSLPVFNMYRQHYNPSVWTKVSGNVWECGECGSWTHGADTATYRESRLIGKVWEAK